MTGGLRQLFVVLGTLLTLSAPGQAENAIFDAAGYRLPTAHHQFEFPRDHGSHPEFRIEWWYITGHVVADGRSRPYGFQATFFRVALAPDAGHAGPDELGTNQLYMAHMALADPESGRFLHEERLNRDGWDAYAREGDLDLRNGNWSLRRIAERRIHLKGTVRGSVSLDLTLDAAKPLVTFGENGLSRKGAEPSAASWYLTFPRLAVTGRVMVNGLEQDVTGEAWMDHEISSSQLGEQQVGWDWASLRFQDGREVMVYIMRTTEGTPDPFSTLAWIDTEGNVTHVGPDAFQWNPRRRWTSSETGAKYPIDVDLTMTDPASGQPTTVRLRPLMDNQEMVGHLGGVSYWEAACEILDIKGDVIGQAYMELTGYAKALGDVLR